LTHSTKKRLPSQLTLITTTVAMLTQLSCLHPMPPLPLVCDLHGCQDLLLNSNIPTTVVSGHIPESTMSQVNICAAEQLVLEQHTLPSRWLLLDSCLTIDTVSNANILHNIYCIELGLLQCPTRPAYSSGLPWGLSYPVWDNPKGSQTYCHSPTS
jgi:hypothetical protein